MLKMIKVMFLVLFSFAFLQGQSEKSVSLEENQTTDICQNLGLQLSNKKQRAICAALITMLLIAKKIISKQKEQGNHE